MLYWDDHWNRILSKVHLSYSEIYFTKVSAIYLTYPELINEIYDRLHPIIEKHNRNKERKPSFFNKNKEPEDEKEEDLKNEEGERDIKEEEENGKEEEAKKRKWREKLDIFKDKNYS